MANLSVEEPDALMCARPGLWEPRVATPGATRPDGTFECTEKGPELSTDVGNGSVERLPSPAVSCHQTDHSSGLSRRGPRPRVVAPFGR